MIEEFIIKLAFEDELDKIAKKKVHPALVAAAIPPATAGTGAALYGLAGLGRAGMPRIGRRLAMGGGIGGAIGIGVAGLIGLSHLLVKADAEGKGLKTAIELAPAIVASAGAISEMKRQR